MALIEAGSPFGPFGEGESFNPILCESLEPIGGHIITDYDGRMTVPLSNEELVDTVHERILAGVDSGMYGSYDEGAALEILGIFVDPSDRENLDPDTCLGTFEIGQTELREVWELTERFGLTVKAIDAFGLPVFEEPSTLS